MAGESHARQPAGCTPSSKASQGSEGTFRGDGAHLRAAIPSRSLRPLRPEHLANRPAQTGSQAGPVQKGKRSGDNAGDVEGLGKDEQNSREQVVRHERRHDGDEQRPQGGASGERLDAQDLATEIEGGVQERRDDVERPSHKPAAIHGDKQAHRDDAPKTTGRPIRLGRTVPARGDEQGTYDDACHSVVD